MDYKEEFEKLADGGDFWKPEEGTFKVTFEGELSTPREVTFDDGKTVNKVDVPITIGKEAFTWSITKGSSPTSCYGQVVTVARYNEILSGVTVTLIVQGKGKSRRYTVVEASECAEKLRKEEEANGSGGKAAPAASSSSSDVPTSKEVVI